jgi:DNA-binding CsgD family transcriptional regulator
VNTIRHSLPLAAYTLWLLALPLKGFLLGPRASTTLLLVFLGPHVAALFRLALGQAWIGRPGTRRFAMLTLAGSGVTAALTLAVVALLHGVRPAAPGWVLAAVLAGLGPAAALVLYRAVWLVQASARPVGTAALGLVLANLALLAVGRLPLPPVAQGVAVAAILGGVAAAVMPDVGAVGGRAPRDAARTGLAVHLGLVFVFYLVNGLRYDLLMVDLAPAFLSRGGGLLLYSASALAAWPLSRLRMDLPLALAVASGIVSLSLFQFPDSVFQTASLLSLNVSSGLGDVFVLALVVTRADWPRALGLAVGAMCLGIASGELLAGRLGGAETGVVLAGTLVLAGALLALYWQDRGPGRGRPTSGTEEAAVADPVAGADEAPAHARYAGLSGPQQDLLSPQEQEVVRRLGRGQRYREMARDLGISESSVKTYVRRAAEKLGVNGRQGLLSLFSRGRGG